MHDSNSSTSERFDLVLEAVRCLGASVEEAAHYSGLRPATLLEYLRGKPELLVEVAMARHAFLESDQVSRNQVA